MDKREFIKRWKPVVPVAVQALFEAEVEELVRTEREAAVRVEAEYPRGGHMERHDMGQ